MTLSGGQPDAAISVTLQSAYNNKWYLGFGPNPLRKRRRNKKKIRNSHFHRGIVYTRDGNEATLTRKMAHNPKKNRNLPAQVKTDRCDFRFYTGRYTPHNVEKEWKGLFEHMLENIEYKLADDLPDQKRKITKTANEISKSVFNRSNRKFTSKFRTKPFSPSKFKKSQSNQFHKNARNARFGTNDSLLENKPTLPSHEIFNAQRFKSKMISTDDEVALSNGEVISFASSVEDEENPNHMNGFNSTSKLIQNDIIYNKSLMKQEGNSQTSLNLTTTNAFSLANVTSLSSKNIFKPSQTSYTKISKNNQPAAYPQLKNNIGVIAQATKDHVPISSKITHSETKGSSLNSASKEDFLKEKSDIPLSSKPQSMRRRQKLLKRIDSLKRPKSVKHSKTYPVHYKKQAKDGSKLVKARLRQRRLRLKYLRQHERPVSSYLYMHNIPQKVKRRIPRQKPTISPHTGTEVSAH